MPSSARRATVSRDVATVRHRTCSTRGHANFRAGKFRLVSTWEGMPTDDDLFQTISRGMPGSAMPSWGHLSEDTRWALVAYLKSLVETPLQVKPPSSPVKAGDVRHGNHHRSAPSLPMTPPQRHAPRSSSAMAAPPVTARPPGETASLLQIDDTGLPIRPRDLTIGVFKGSPAAESLYRHIIAGMPGSADAEERVGLRRRRLAPRPFRAIAVERCAAGPCRDAPLRDRGNPRRNLAGSSRRRHVG